MQADARRIERFFHVLLEEIRSNSPVFLEAPFTVAEIYQSLIPYRTHRDRLGVEMNGDYEDALLRLLGGEGDYLVLESEPARARIRRELEDSNPNPGLYRDFAAVDVRLNPEKVPDGDGEGRSWKGWGAASDRGTLFASEEEGEGRLDTRPVSSDRASGLEERVESPGLSSGAARASTPESCPECDAVLPVRDFLRFCPECGTNVLLSSCPQCGEDLEWTWKYCVACGKPTGS